MGDVYAIHFWYNHAFDLVPALGIGMRQNVLAADLVVQGVEAIAGFRLGKIREQSFERSSRRSVSSRGTRTILKEPETRRLKNRGHLARNRKFESISLQRRVRCEQ
jgi:hypothetical protein